MLPVVWHVAVVIHKVGNVNTVRGIIRGDGTCLLKNLGPGATGKEARAMGLGGKRVSNHQKIKFFGTYV